jgi:hypothetical protein
MKKIKEPKQKKITKKELARIAKLEKKKMWEEVRQSIIIRDNGCAICHSYSGMNVHHLLPREIEELFFNKLNLLCLCYHHHKFGSPINDISAHKNALPFVIWLARNRPEQFEFLSKFSEEKWLKNL